MFIIENIPDYKATERQTSRLNLIIPGTPTAKQSMKFTRKGISYQTKEVKQNAQNMKALIVQQLPTNFKIIDKAVSVKYEFVFPVTSDFSKSKRQLIKTGTKFYKDKKPDLDNIQKAVNDALTGIVLLDDALICKAEVEKYYGEAPCINLTIELINN